MDRGSLNRHEREVHGSPAYLCPIASCNRHTKGFNRKYNLFEHQKRCHPHQSLDASTTGARSREDSTTTNRGSLREKLEKLRLLRAELDSDINALERAVELLGDPFS
jgi:hypothetical protein